MKNCQNCAHFRKERSLVKALTLPFHSLQLANTMNSVQQNEQSMKSAEFQQRTLLINNIQEEWPFRPKTVSYCGISEKNMAQMKYYVNEVKNADFDCQDFLDKKLISPRPCDSCRHKILAQGPSQDSINLLDAIDPSQLSYSSDLMKQGLDTAMNVRQNRTSQEMTEAMYNGGYLTNVPRYYDWCQKYSKNGEYVLCNYENHDDMCKGWER